MKALWAAGVVDRRVNEDQLAVFKYFQQVDATEQTFYEGVFRLSQGHCLSIGTTSPLRKRRYWDIDPRHVADAVGVRRRIAEAAELHAMADALRLRMGK